MTFGPVTLLPNLRHFCLNWEKLTYPSMNIELTSFHNNSLNKHTVGLDLFVYRRPQYLVPNFVGVLGTWYCLILVLMCLELNFVGVLVLLDICCIKVT